MDSADGATLEVHDGCERGYSWRTLAATASGRAPEDIFCLRIPVGAMKIAAAVNLSGCYLLGRAPMVTPGKVRELYHADWLCRDNPLVRMTEWRPEVTAKEGLARTVAWYQRQGWL